MIAGIIEHLMVEKGPSAPKIPLTPKATRANPDQTKAKEPSQKNPPK